MAWIEVCPLDELPAGAHKIVRRDELAAGVFNAAGELYAIEDRCSHDDGRLCEGEWEPDEHVVVCPRHGARFDIRTGKALSLPAYIPVAVYPVRVRDDGWIEIDLA